MRRVGLAAFEEQKSRREQFKTVGGELQLLEAAKLRQHAEQLQTLLRTYGREHQQEIKQSRALREQFAKLCARLGIDALSYELETNNVKRINSKEHQYALGARVISICRRTREDNGGIISMPQLLNMLANDKYPLQVRAEDIRQAVKTMSVLGPGLQVDKLPNGNEIVRSLPKELNNDQVIIVMACDVLGYVTRRMLCDNMKWTSSRSQQALDDMVAIGLLWVDSQASPTQFWSPSAMSFPLIT